MGRRVLAIIAIFLCTTVGWIILGQSINVRTHDSGDGLAPRVASAWGTPQQQTPPTATTAAPLSLEQSRIRVGLDLVQRQKGLLWFPTYRVDFRGSYVFRNDTSGDCVTLRLVFPAKDAIYDDLVFRVDGQPVPVTTADGAVTACVHRPPGVPIRLDIGYRSQGLGTWSYTFGNGVCQVSDFVLEMRTNFDAIDFPAGTLSPSEETRVGRGWLLRWKYSDVITGHGIGMIMPEKVQPGPMAGRISFFAPVSLLFFFFLMFVITALKKIELHPMHYFFLATSFFAFHLLLAYLVDHISIHIAFAICSAVSIFLVVSYLRIIVSPRFAWREAALSQFVYLILFSYAFFLKGFTGLAITIGAIVTLFVTMQITARIQWSADVSSARG